MARNKLEIIAHQGGYAIPDPLSNFGGAFTFSKAKSSKRMARVVLGAVGDRQPIHRKPFHRIRQVRLFRL